MKRKIIITEPLPAEKIEYLENEAEKLGFRILYAPGESVNEDTLKEAEIFFGIYNPKLEIPQNLKWICLPTAGINGYTQIDGIKSGRCILSSSSGAYGVTISEHIITLVLMMMRRIPEYQNDRNLNIWRNDRKLKSIYGSRITVLGTGDIGTCTAARLKNFEPERIIGISRTGIKKSEFYNEVYPVTMLNSVLPETDLLIMSLPETNETVNIIGEKELELLPEGAMLVNVGRGSAINEAALIRALLSHKLSAAALDVMQHEPLQKDDPMQNVPNLILTPHMAGQRTLKRTVDKIVEMFAADLQNYALGREIIKRINVEKGY